MPTNQAATFAWVLRRFRRRLRMSVFARSVPVACAIALVAIDAALLIARPQAAVAALWCAGALTLAIVSVWVVALVRTPSLPVTAQMVDRQLRLENRAVTALQFAEARDAVSRLVVAEATARLEMIPASSLPLGVSAPFRWVAVAVLAVSALIVVGLAAPVAEPSSGVAPGETSADAAARTGRAGAQRGRSGRARASDEAREGAPATGLPRPTPAPETNRVEGTEVSGDARPSVGGGASPTPVDGASDRRARVASASDRRTEGLPPSRGTSDGNLDGGRGDAARGAPSALSAAGRGARGAVSASAAGGGVAGGAFTRAAAASIATAPPTTIGIGTAGYRRAYTHAEAAMATERVPQRLRSYVRDYFLAIRPRPGQ